MSEPVKTALTGYGYAGKTFHAPLIRAARGLALSTVVSSRPDEVHVDIPGVRVLDFESALADPAIELVVIATPNDLHAPQAIEALKAGKHVVIDKPFAITTAEAETVLAAAKTANRLATVFHNRRWDGDFLTAKSLIDSGKLGEVSLFISRFDRFRPYLRNRWREQSLPGSGLWYDLGAHLVDQALCLFGSPDVVALDLAQQREGSVVDDYFHATLFYGPHRVRLQASTLTPAPGPRFEVHGRRGSWVKYGLDTQEDDLKAGKHVGGEGWGLDRDGLFTPVADIDPLPPVAQPTLPGRYEAFYEGMAAAIRGNGPLPVAPQEALNVMRLLDLARESAETGHVIRL
ncbi:oxidoreductase [Asticcacaulis sp. AND118]|nr:oxidoreductase [Asticcacaulis sp. AND118]UDF05645.1 oxidoreductase [Asticcacaulis sp. AND118]